MTGTKKAVEDFRAEATGDKHLLANHLKGLWKAVEHIAELLDAAHPTVTQENHFPRPTKDEVAEVLKKHDRARRAKAEATGRELRFRTEELVVSMYGEEAFDGEEPSEASWRVAEGLAEGNGLTGLEYIDKRADRISVDGKWQPRLILRFRGKVGVITETHADEPRLRTHDED